MLLKNGAFKNASIYILLAFIQKSISFFLVPLYTSVLSPSEFGIVNQTIALGSFYVIIFTFALDEAAARFYFSYRNDNKQTMVLGTIISFSIIVSIVGSVLLLSINSIFYRLTIPNIPINYIFLSVVIIVSSPIYSIYQKMLRIKEDAKTYSFMMVGYSATQILLSVTFLVIIQLNSLGYILALSLTSFLFGAYSLYQLRHEVSICISPSILKEAIRYSSSIVPHTISGWGLKGFTIIVLGKTINSAAVGIFNAINFIAVIINVLTKAIMDAYQPWVYRTLEHGDRGYDSVIEAARFIGIAFVLLGFLLSLTANEIIHTFINNQYHSGIYIAPFLVFSSVVLAIGSLIVYVLYYNIENTKYIGIATTIGAIVNIILCAILIPRYSILGAALAVSIANLVISILKQIFAAKAMNIKVLYIDVYSIAVLNLVISYYALSYQLEMVYRILIFTVELTIIISFNRKVLLSYYQRITNHNM